MNAYVYTLTGEVIYNYTKLGACLYFMKDAQKYGYEFEPKYIKRIVKKTGKPYGEK